MGSLLMSQEKAKIHPLFAVPNTAQTAPAERDFYESPDAGGEPEVCSLCYGTGMEIVAGKGARPCQCRKQKAKEAFAEKLRIPRRYEKCNLNNYYPKSQSQTDAKNFAFKLANNYPVTEQGLLFMGTVGIGKTHLAVSILKLLTERSFSCLFYEFGALLKEIQASYSQVAQTSELKVLAPIFDAEILVLDEIGASKPTDWVRDTMAHIINTRYNDKKLTIFTTNYLDERRAEREETLEDRIGVRLRSRLFEMCRTISITGEDFRRTFDQAAQIKKK